jgi:hypothetical protein
MRMSEVLRQLRQQRSTAGARPRLLQRFEAFLPVSGSTPAPPVTRDRSRSGRTGASPTDTSSTGSPGNSTPQRSTVTATNCWARSPTNWCWSWTGSTVIPGWW